MSRQGLSSRLIHITFVLFFFQALVISIRAEIVPPGDALRVAGNFIYELRMQGDLQTDIATSIHTVRGPYDAPQLYIVNVGSAGFIVVAGETEVYPILGWSLKGAFNDESIPPSFTAWMTSYTTQIDYIRSEGLQGDAAIADAWSRYLTDPAQYSPTLQIESQPVGPLLTCQWNQNNYYNAYCPTDPDGPGGRALAGCVATAMGQVMYYYRHPQTGVGSSAYFHPNYGTLSVNHGNTQYKWNEMSNLATAKGHQAVAELLYHLGVAVDMNYGPNASGAYSSNAAAALIDHFGYDQSLYLAYKNNHTDASWATLLRNNLDAGHPMYYHGYGSGGHAFNVDGYQNNTHFHFNWGWGGAYDGYFFLSSLNPGSNSFTSGQGAIVNFKPAASGYPLNCTGNQTATSLTGSIEDGSGPIAPYQNNLNCSYLIQPSGLVSRVEIKFQRFSTQSNQDIVYIHDGDNQNAPVLATISGDTIFPLIVTTGGSAYIRFVTNGSVSSGGWYLTYEGFRPVFCQNLQTFTSPSGLFDDGSGQNIPYNNNTNCKFLINTGTQQPVEATFNYFSLEDGKDYLRVYDPSTIPSTLLTQLTGQTLPSPVTGSKGQLMFIFYTDSDNPDTGWEISYTTLTGMDEVAVVAPLIFPNPATGHVNIRFSQPHPSSTLLLHDLSGRLVRALALVGNDARGFEADLSGIAPGVYLITTGTDGQTRPAKLIIR
jgi:hypothetical protein